jgi:hypothetical protein
MEPQDILSSKIKKLLIELPHYSFSHSSSGDSSHTFIGRERYREKLRKVIEDSTDEPGVYLITGNRGVGKTNLVSKVINETSLPTNSNFFKNLRYLFLLLLAVTATQFCSQTFSPIDKIIWIVSQVLFLPLFVTLCCCNGYRRKLPKRANIWKKVKNGVTSAFKELGCLINPYNPYRKTQYVLKLVLVVCYTQICSLFSCISPTSPTQAFVFYLCFVLSFMFRGFIRGKLREDYRKYKKDKRSGRQNDSINDIEKKCCIRWINSAFNYYTAFTLLLLPLAPWEFTYKVLVAVVPPLVMVFARVYVWHRKYLKTGTVGIIAALTLNPIKNYIKNHNRLYLRINFGHRLKDEKDILRLITRTLSTEYSKYRRSFWRMLPWRTMAFGVLLLFAYLFSGIVEKQEFYKPIKKSALYMASSQVLLKTDSSAYVKTDASRLHGAFSKVMTKTKIKVTALAKMDSIDKTLSEHATVENIVNTSVGAATVDIFLLVLDQIVFETTKGIKSIPQYLWKGYLYSGNKTVSPMNYLFWLSFFAMYLFYVLLFRSTWITHFFVTHRIIARRLKKLNSDITHSTEREYSIGANAERYGYGIGTRTKKSRNVADAREIEKELQDILDDMRRIPSFMCRPSVVIVFDELDKVEPGETNSEKENPQTKALLFSIGATRERQTEILRILSNMKYFLSTANAKFIFIAGREIYDIYLADVSERDNHIGSIFNVVIYVPSFLTDHPTGKKSSREESSIASLPEEFVCRRLFPHDSSYPVESYDLKNYRIYLEKVIYKYDPEGDKGHDMEIEQQIQKIIVVLQQFIIYLAHISKGAPKKMTQLFETFVVVRDIDGREEKKSLVVRQYHSSRNFLSFNYYKQYTLGIVAYLITPIFYRLAESNIKEHSDKLLVSTLRFVDFLFKFHKHSFTWKHLEISPEIIEVNHAPELKSVAVDLLNYLSQVHINKSNFGLYDYKFDSWIANEIFTMTKTDEVFSALFSFSLDEMLPLKQHYRDLLEKNEKEYQKEGQNDKTSVKYIDAVSSLQIVLGDLCYYDDELEEAIVFYKNAIQLLSENYGNKGVKKMSHERLYLYVRNKLKVGMIHEKRKQYDFAYLTYSGLCDRIIQGQDTTSNVSLGKITYEGLKLFYLPFLATLQIQEKSHIGGITRSHLEQLKNNFDRLVFNINHNEAILLKFEFFSRVADVLYYKNSDLMKLRCTENKNNNEETTMRSCTACYYYYRSLSILLDQPILCKPDKNTVIELLRKSVNQVKENHNMRALAKILSDWGNVFFSCDNKSENCDDGCYICGGKTCNTQKSNYPCACYICGKSAVECDSQCACIVCGVNDCETRNLCAILEKYINHVSSESNEENMNALLTRFEMENHFTKMEVAFAMYSISSEAYRKVNLYKQTAYQLYKMLCLFKQYGIYRSKKSKGYIKKLSEKAIHYLWHANDDLNVFELNKRKKDFDRFDKFDKGTQKHEESKDLLPNLLVDSEITKVRILVKELELESVERPDELKKYYDMRITSPYRINYSIGGRIYRLRLKSTVNNKAYQMLFGKDTETTATIDGIASKMEHILENGNCDQNVRGIFGTYFGIKERYTVTTEHKIEIMDNLIADTIYSLIDIVQLSETMGETIVFTHSFMGLVHEEISLWIRRYKAYKQYLWKNADKGKLSRIDDYLEKYLDEEWRELLSGYRENQQALLHYRKCLEMHSGGRAYHDMIDTMYYVKDDYNDRSDHFSIAIERHQITNGEIEKKINELKDVYKDIYIYDAEKYFEQSPPPV